MPWKKYQNNKRLKKRTKLALIVLGLIILVIISGNLVRLTQTLFSPWKLNAGQSKNYSWNGDFNLNLVIKKDSSISVLVFNPKEGRVILINIPPQTLIEVPKGFGKWQIRSIYDLGETDKKLSGVKLLEDSLTGLLAVPIDGFLDIGSLQQVSDADQLVALFRQNLIGGFVSIFSIKTDLTLWELVKLKFGIASVRFDKARNLSLSQGLEKDNLADGTQVLLPDPIRIDGNLEDVADPTIKSEHKNIAIFNATDRVGLAQKAARIVTNMGGSAIILTNAQKKIKNTQVIGEKSQTLNRMTQVFQKPCQANCDKIDPQDEVLASSRAQINIILGEDFEK